MYATAPQAVLEARPAAIRFAKEIGELANKKWKNGSQMAGMIAHLVLQNIVMSIAVTLHDPGSKEGMDFINDMYDGCKRDAAERWNAPDLKHHFKHKPKG
jgi:hypothetical protein